MRNIPYLVLSTILGMMLLISACKKTEPEENQSGRLNFYFAHNRHHYGFQSLKQTPLHGLDKIECQ